MPPQHRFLASRLQGYVCRACLSKSQGTLRKQPLWLSRNASNGRKPLRSKGPNQPVDQEPDFRFFEQGPDGTRVEIDPLKAMEAELQDYQMENEKSIEDLVRPVEFKSFLNDHGQHESPHPMSESLAAVTKSTDELEALVERLDNIDINSLSTEDRLKLREELLKSAMADESTPVEIVSEPSPLLAHQSKDVKVSPKVDLIPVESFDTKHRDHLFALNNALIRNQNSAAPSLAHRPHITSTRDIWKCYLLCQNALRSTPHAIPPQVWQILWDKFDAETGSNLDRMRRIKVLGEDISSAGIHLDPPRRLLYIESIFISGDRNIALREWKAAEHLQKDQTYFQNHCELGVRMYSQVGNVNQALRVAERCLQNSQDPSHFRILLPIIQASLNSKEGYPVQLAWALYIRMRSHLGAQMMMEDYDTVTSMFLIANQPDLALGAFTDMMLTGSSSAVEQDSTAQYRKAAGVKHLNSIAVQNRELKWENSRVFTKLPARFNNRFFFGSWLKKLIGEGKLDAAKQVFDHMQARRIKPDSKHMNGLIGAWLRQGTEGTRILAEDMAWTMIQSRIDFVKSREAAYNLIAPLQVIETYDRRSSKSLTLIPSATSETFAILIEQYRRRQKPELVVDLCKALRNARIRPSTYFMNELLLCDSRAHRLGWVWDTYYSLSKETGVRPDFDTYEILWTLIKKVSAHTHAASKQSTSFPPCRRLFADMVERGSKDDLPREIYNLVILSFSLTLDQAGTAVALRALQRNFGMYPDEETAHIIVKQLARLGLTNELGDTPRRLNLRSSETRKRIHNVTRILEKFRVQRVEVLAEQGIVFDELKGDAKAEEFLLLLSDLLRYVAQARIAAEQRHNFNAAIASKTAAEQMGVPDCVPWLAHEKGEVEIV